MQLGRRARRRQESGCGWALLFHLVLQPDDVRVAGVHGITQLLNDVTLVDGVCLQLTDSLMQVPDLLAQASCGSVEAFRQLSRAVCFWNSRCNRACFGLSSASTVMRSSEAASSH